MHVYDASLEQAYCVFLCVHSDTLSMIANAPLIFISYVFIV